MIIIPLEKHLINASLNFKLIAVEQKTRDASKKETSSSENPRHLNVNAEHQPQSSEIRFKSDLLISQGCKAQRKLS